MIDFKEGDEVRARTKGGLVVSGTFGKLDPDGVHATVLNPRNNRYVKVELPDIQLQEDIDERNRVKAAEERARLEEEERQRREEEARLAGREPKYVSYANPEAMGGFVEYLKSTKYSLFVICRKSEHIHQVESEYASWTATLQNPEGEALTASTLKTYIDEDCHYGRCWCLDFSYAPGIDYPFSILERGTGDHKMSRSPVAWLKNDRIESRYAETAELVIRGGLRAFKA